MNNQLYKTIAGIGIWGMILLIFFSYNGIGQEALCGYRYGDDWDRSFIEKSKSFEHTYARNNSRNSINSITIPVVVHIIYNNGPENISDEDVEDAIDRLNSNFSNSGYFEEVNGVNTQIQFCLAQRDSVGGDFNGILRVQSEDTDMSLKNLHGAIVGLSSYPSEEVMNIWVVEECCRGDNCGVAGYAVNSNLGARSNRNGIVVEYDYFISSGNKQKVVVHEAGHYLGLLHTFTGGCRNDHCLEDGDRVCDTPPDNRTFEGCLIETNSCRTDVDDASINNPYRSVSDGGLGDQPDMNENFLDYNLFSCFGRFTEGQVDRMHQYITIMFPKYQTSRYCLPPCDDAIVADFDLPDSIEVGSELSIINTSMNAEGYQWRDDSKQCRSELHI